MWQNSKTQNVTNLKNSKCDKTQNLTKTQNVTKLKMLQNSKIQNVTIFYNSIVAGLKNT